MLPQSNVNTFLITSLHVHGFQYILRSVWSKRVIIWLYQCVADYNLYMLSEHLNSKKSEFEQKKGLYLNIYIIYYI